MRRLNPREAVGIILPVLAASVLGGTVALAQKARPSGPAGRARAAPRREPADNSYCLACHVNFKREALAETHRKAGIGCARCHGESDKHSSDENNITPPDIMFAAERINASCARCHTPAALAAASKRNPRALHKGVLQGKALGFRRTPTCTTCHGAHRISTRTRRWDKNTGKLIEDDGVRMVKESGKPD